MLTREELESINDMRYLCELVTTYINGVELEYNDFGKKYDKKPGKAEPFGCGDMQFIPFTEVKEDTLKKYNITEDEYRQIQSRLKKCLSFGYCGWCV